MRTPFRTDGKVVTRAITLGLLALAAMLATAAPARAGTTDREFFARLLEKNGLRNGLFRKDRIACVCQGGTTNGEAGVMTYADDNFEDHLVIFCLVPIFDGTGTFHGATFCDNFGVIAK